MDPNVALGMVIMLSLIAAPLGIAKWRRWEGAKVLGKIVAQTGGQVVSYRELRCRRHGHDVQFFRDRNRDTSVITMPLPAGYPLAIDVRRRGLLVLPTGVPRLELDDVQFDRAFTVQAAPAAVVEQLLGVAVRSFLLEHRESVLVVKDGRLQLSLDAVQDAVALEAIEVTVAIASGIRDAFARLAAEAESIAQTDGASPYRPIAVEAGPDLAHAHEAEVENLERMQRRAMWVDAAQLVVFVAAGLAVLAAIKLMNHR